MNIAPPQNVQAEQELLGTLLAYYTPQAIHIVQAAGLLCEDFYRWVHQVIYRAILNIHKQGQHVDDVMVARFLQTHRDQDDTPFLARVGGKAQLELLVCAARPYGLKERALIIHEDGRWRRWLGALYDAQVSVHDRDSDAFWEAIQSIRVDVPAGTLHVVKEEAA